MKYEQNLGSHWGKVHDEKGGFIQTPLWTYFDVAEAHQWLYLGLASLNGRGSPFAGFWASQTSPALYTWWQGNGEENTFHLWEQVRGWVKPPYVTPHYWTASEMLLLQLDMLVYIDESTSNSVVVIGGGVPPGWLSQPMRVRNLPTRFGSIDWTWEGEKMRVIVHGEKCRVRLGPAFRAETPLEIEYAHPH